MFILDGETRKKFYEANLGDGRVENQPLIVSMRGWGSKMSGGIYFFG